jgi:hypothetical protein
MPKRFLLPTLVTAFLNVAVGTPAHAAFETGNQLFEVCQPSADYFSQGACTGFVMAVSDAMEAAQAFNGTVARWRACVPVGITAGQAKDVTVRYLTRYPERRHLVAATLVAAALAEAFPCPAVTSQQ